MIRTLTCLLTLAVLSAGCGGGGNDDPPAFVVPTAPPETTAIVPDSLPVAALDTAPTDAPPTDAAAAPNRPAPTPSRSADDTPTPAPPPAPPEDDRWTTAATHVAHRTATMPVLRTVRSARHPAHDRLVFEFTGGLPGYHIEYIDRPVRECGSGNAVDALSRYDGLLSVRFEMARAHTTTDYQPTIRRELEQLGYPNAQAYRLVCDFEGEVVVVLGLNAPTPYRAIELADPARLALDVQH